MGFTKKRPCTQHGCLEVVFNLPRHLRERHGVIAAPVYKCGCGQAFKRMERLDEHRALEHGDGRVYECCGHKFARESDLRRHRASHKLSITNLTIPGAHMEQR
jgi:hypothetical protein